MRRNATLAVVGVAVLLVAAQFALPAYIGGRVEDRLTDGGGSADVKLNALPSARLLFGEGDSVRVRARGISLPLVNPSAKVFEQLDGFGDVDVQVSDANAGPFRLTSVTLQRSGDGAYRTTLQGTITARDLATFGAAQLGGAFGGFLGGLAGGSLPFGDRELPIDLTAVVRSDGGRPQTVSVDGQVAGVPAGPIAEVLAQALAGRF
jgi:hypothetical protein